MFMSDALSCHVTVGGNIKIKIKCAIYKIINTYTVPWLNVV